VVDLGFATTFDVINAAGAYVGGVIAPGVEVSLSALGSAGAQLRQVELDRPRAVIARNTIEALQSGAVYGFAGQVDGIVTKILAELGEDGAGAEVVATGLVDSVVAAECTTLTRLEPHLTLHGLRLIFQRNTS
jgi:type III pantothenate kinase